MQTMKFTTVSLVLLTVALVSTTAHAVKPGRLWLPKNYQYAMGKLENTAYLAGTTERCTEVVAGKIDHSKSSADNFHFVITCRDDKRRSFNMIYNYPADAGAPELVFEQQRPEPEPELAASEAEDGLSGDEAWLLCTEVLTKKTKNMIDVLTMDENPTPGLVAQEVYHFTIPFEAKNPSGSRLKYNGLCEVLLDSTTTLTIKVRK